MRIMPKILPRSIRRTTQRHSLTEIIDGVEKNLKKGGWIFPFRRVGDPKLFSRKPFCEGELLHWVCSASMFGEPLDGVGMDELQRFPGFITRHVRENMPLREIIQVSGGGDLSMSEPLVFPGYFPTEEMGKTALGRLYIGFYLGPIELRPESQKTIINRFENFIVDCVPDRIGKVFQELIKAYVPINDQRYCTFSHRTEKIDRGGVMYHSIQSPNLLGITLRETLEQELHHLMWRTRRNFSGDRIDIPLLDISQIATKAHENRVTISLLSGYGLGFAENRESFELPGDFVEVS